MATVLFDDGHEEVRLEEWRANSAITVDNPASLELLSVSGSFLLEGATMNQQDWARLPAGMDLRAQVGEQDAFIWMKRGPLLHPDVCAF
nr:hypothetical protein [Phyllobacterium salinisoli]